MWWWRSQLWEPERGLTSAGRSAIWSAVEPPGSTTVKWSGVAVHTFRSAGRPSFAKSVTSCSHHLSLAPKQRLESTTRWRSEDSLKCWDMLEPGLMRSGHVHNSSRNGRPRADSRGRRDFSRLWRERTSARQSWIAIVSGVVLATWAIVTTMLARRGVFQPPDPYSFPPIAITLILVLLALAACLLGSPSLRHLLTNQRNLILLNLWRLVGAVFLILMANGQMPALWALPAGIGDVIVGAMVPWIAMRVGRPQGRRRAIIFTLFGMADLVVAVGLGVMTSPGAAQIFHTTPTSELATRFPLVLVPTFLVPLAFVLHVVSLWQLLGGPWVPTATSFVLPSSITRASPAAEARARREV